MFKQKTAYEMRISDWSSDVCSSDLNASFLLLNAVVVRRKRVNRPGSFQRRTVLPPGYPVRSPTNRGPIVGAAPNIPIFLLHYQCFEVRTTPASRHRQNRARVPESADWRHSRARERGSRSEEHTSELQSLMRISYAVFGLKKNNKHREQI